MQRLPQIAGLSGLLLIFTLSTPAAAQGGHPSTQPATTQSDSSMQEQMAELRTNVARLEAALQMNHQGHSARDGTGSNHPGMAGPSGMDGMAMGMNTQKKPMNGMANMGGDGMTGMGGPGGMPSMKPKPAERGDMSGMKMGMGKSKGMKMMGAMSGSAGSEGMATNSALPGFPGVSHIYHTGASGFFLDHDNHIALTPDQKAALGRFKEKSMLAQNSADRQIQEAEQQLWELTAADKPDAARIEKKIREIEKLRGDRRLGFIRAVGEAAKVLSADQRKMLLGQGPQPPVKDDPQHQHQN
jgi:Spy/CpxP family protein refolding chaperone